MDYIFESLINRYDELVIQEYCYGESYYTEEAKMGLLQKIGKFISNLCVKIMNKIKEIINKITGKEIYVKAPKDMDKKVKEVDGWLSSFAKLVAAIKNGVVGAIKQLLGLMKNHPIVTGAILATGGYIMVRSGQYDKWCKKFGSITQRIKDGVAVIMGKKEFVEKGEYEAAVEASTNAKAALVNTQKLLDECKLDNHNKEVIIQVGDEEIKSLNNKIDKANDRLQNVHNRYNKVAKIARNSRVNNRKLKETIKDQNYALDVSKKSIMYMQDKYDEDMDRVNKDFENNLRIKYSTIFNQGLAIRRDDEPGFREFSKLDETRDLIDEFKEKIQKSNSVSSANNALRYIDREFKKWKSNKK
jgi:hypothetical protein